MDPHVLAGLSPRAGVAGAHAGGPPVRDWSFGTGAPEYGYSGAPVPPGTTIGTMLWSDPENEPPREMREMEAMMRRVGVLLALAMVVAMITVGLR